LETIKTKLENQQFEGLTKDDIIGDMLYAGALSDLVTNDANLKMLNQGEQALAYRQPSFGTFSTNLDTIYSFGVPRQVEMSGIMVDMDAVTQSLWTKNNDAQMVKTIVQQVGMMTSAWEHRIPELLFTNDEHPGEAVSAVKALVIASAQGQRIYQVTSENMNAVLPVLNINTNVKDEIRAFVAVGKVATVSQNNITIDEWTGVGYIIADAETGAGAYRISGGDNEGEYKQGALAGLNLIFTGSLFIVIGIHAFLPLLVGIFMFITGFILYYGLEPDAPFNINCGLEILDEVLALLLMTGPFWKGEKALKVVAQAFALVYGAKHFLSKIPSEKCPIDI